MPSALSLLHPASMGLEAHAALGPAVAVLWAAWALLLGTGATGLWRMGQRGALRQPQVLAVLGLVGFAVVLRFGLPDPTPEMRWRLVFAYRPGLYGLTDIEKYGLGFPLLVRTVVAFVGADLRVPYVLNALLGGFAVVPMVGLVRALGASRSAALWSGFVLAVTPMLVWYAHTDGPFAADAVFTLTALWGVAAYARTGRALWLAVAAAAFVSTAQMRVESVLTGAAAVALALVLPAFSWRRPAPWVAAGAALLALLPHLGLVLPGALGTVDMRAGSTSDATWQDLVASWIAFEPTVQSIVLIVLAPLGLLAPGLSRPVKLWSVVVFLVFASLSPDIEPTQTAFSVIRYQIRSLLPWAWMAGLGLDLVVQRMGRGAGALAVAGCLLGLSLATTSSMLGREHEVFRSGFGLVPSPCTMVSYLSQGDVALSPPTHLSVLTGADHRWRDLDDKLPATGCVVYWRSSGCTGHYQDGVEDPHGLHPACAEFEATWRLEPLYAAQVEPDPVGPMGIPNRFPGVPIPVGFYRVVGRRDARP